jgi:hypothetical protein
VVVKTLIGLQFRRVSARSAPVMIRGAVATEIQVDENAKYGAPGAPIRGRLHLERLPDLERSAAATDYTAESNTRRRGDHAVDVSTMRAAVSNPARTDAARAQMQQTCRSAQPIRTIGEGEAISVHAQIWLRR